MKTVLTFVWATTLVLPSFVTGQIYLVTGTPLGNYSIDLFPSSLLEVSEGRTLESTQIASGKVGIQWLSISYDWRKAVALAGDKILVIDLDRASIVKSCTQPHIRGTSLIDQWVADVPGRGPTFEWFVSAGANNNRVQGMLVDPATPCDKSFADVPPNEMRYVIAHGTAGVANMFGKDWVTAYVNRSGDVRGVAALVDFSYGYNVPKDLMAGHESASVGVVLANNARAFVLGLGSDNGDRFQTLAFRKSDRTWHVVPKAGRGSRIRLFGSIVTVMEADSNAERPEDATPAARLARRAAGNQSAGRAEWTLKRTDRGPSLVELFEASDTVFPGRLHLFDVSTDQLMTINTDQADSEILLIEKGIVYYRVSNRLYSGSITSGGISQPSLLADDELIRDSHWAFMKQ
jgi:hypothetical protein